MTIAATPLLRRAALESFACEYRFQQIHEIGVPDTSDESRRGIAYHSAAFGEHGYVQRLAAHQVRADHELAAEALRDALVRERTPQHLIADVSEIYARWVENFELDLDAYLLAEKRQTAAGVTWQPDLAYARVVANLSELEVEDHKTGHVGLTEAQAKQEFQPQVYMWQARLIWPGFDRYKFTHVFPRLGQQVSTYWDEEDFDKTERQVQILMAQIAEARKANKWPAVPGPHCSFCRLQCPVLDAPENRALEIYRVLDERQAVTVGGEVLALEQRLKHRKAALSAYVSEHGPVDVNGMEFAYRASVSQSFPIKPVLAVLESAGIDPSFDVSKSAVKSYVTARKYSHVRPAILAHAIEKTSWRFSAKKLGTFGSPDDEEQE